MLQVRAVAEGEEVLADLRARTIGKLRSPAQPGVQVLRELGQERAVVRECELDTVLAVAVHEQSLG